MLQDGLLDRFTDWNYIALYGHMQPPNFSVCLIAVPAARYLPLITGELAVDRVIASLNRARVPLTNRSLTAALARRRTMPWVFLRERETRLSFGVFAYYMPCLFRTPAAQALHLDACAHFIRNTCGTLPFLFAGDFNFLPDSALHRFATTGTADASLQPIVSWRSEAVWAPLHDVLTKRTDLLTARSRTMHQKEAFSGRLDYIWTSSTQWRLTKVQIPVTESDLPNADQGSDHLPLALTFWLQQ
jgi:endonuclease/exonuclease/phosphatase family metal-dependent hydrolase